MTLAQVIATIVACSCLAIRRCCHRLSDGDETSSFQSTRAYTQPGVVRSKELLRKEELSMTPSLDERCSFLFVRRPRSDCLLRVLLAQVHRRPRLQLRPFKMSLKASPPSHWQLKRASIPVKPPLLRPHHQASPFPQPRLLPCPCTLSAMAQLPTQQRRTDHEATFCLGPSTRWMI